MLGRRPGKKHAQAKGRGAAAAKELGLFVDFNPEDIMMGIPDDPDDGDLEAELAALTGDNVIPKSKPKGKAPLPMDHIEKMAQDCMRDLDTEEEDDEGDLEEDDDLLAELQEVVGKDEESDPTDIQDDGTATQGVENAEHQIASTADTRKSSLQTSSEGLLQTLQDRIINYKSALTNAQQRNESSKVRRYERALKTLESMVRAAEQGKCVNEEEMPPPVANWKPSEENQPEPIESAVNRGSSTEVSVATGEEQAAPQATKSLLMMRQREYKMAALRAKQCGDVEKAKEYMKISKKFSSVLEAMENGQPVDLSQIPPELKDPDGKTAELVAAEPQQRVPASNPGVAALSQALQQRMERYRSAAEQAKANGDERKARMHERIVKQYQDAIRTQNAGRQQNLSDLPVPPGFPPLPGMECTEGVESVEKALEFAHNLANAAEDEGAEDEEDKDDQPAKKPVHQKPTQIEKLQVLPNLPQDEKVVDTSKSTEPLPPAVRELLEFLETRRRQYRKSALQAKQKNDVELAKQHMRVVHTLQASIDKVKSGTLVDITKIPPAPADEENDFVLIEPEENRSPQNSDEVYAQLIKLLQEQYEKCLLYSKQFIQMGNVAETTRFEKMAEDCKKNCEILHLSQAHCMDPPLYHFEDKTLKVVRVFSELSSTEMLLIIVRGINLPAPSGMAPNDLHAFVKFEFPYPSTEQPQKNKTFVVKSTNSPEYEQSFTLNINRNHRGFKRVVQAKGIKFEIFHKGVFLLRSDKQIGTACVKLDKLETQCEIREIVEVFDGRKPTGGKLEVKIRLREPLNGQDLQTVTEKWLVMDSTTRK
ncbi:coiled-coil and C2 domain-containing protein 1B isoform X2 [Pseudophryne corroboree]|uniref:coiled-coil and C2 domain-containing protein 1B isoform X2 n=1 Tax=Pseudophryne corroboree TaxID=495146 RepID=UPI0030815FD1